MPNRLIDTKTPGVKALGVFVGILWSALVSACPVPESLSGEIVRVAGVHDGDSVRLVDGRRVRLLGINAPELARDGQSAEPLADAARKALARWVEGESVRLSVDRERKDHYGRTLAHLHTREGQSLEARLLRRGLAFHIAVAPNLTLSTCLAGAEAEARRQGRGLWKAGRWPVLVAGEAAAADAGFQRLRGRVTDIQRAGDSVWVELDGPVVVQVPRSVWAALEDRAPSEGERITVRGWLVDRSDSGAAQRGFKPLMLRLQSQYSLEPPLSAGP